MNKSSSVHQISPRINKAIDAFNSRDYALADGLLREVLAIDPHHASANHLHGLIADLCGQSDAAKQLIQRAIKAAPSQPLFYDSLGMVFLKSGDFHEAENAFKAALKLNPNFAQSLNNLAALYQKAGDMQQAEELYLKAHQSGQEWAFDNYLLMLNYLTNIEPDHKLTQHRLWEKNYRKKNKLKAFPLKKIQTDKVLRIGYVSGDFRHHSVAYFFEPLLSSHDRNKFKIYCYYNHPNDDEVTSRLKSFGDTWLNIFSMDDVQVAKQVYKDKIDILIDLSGFSAFNRLGVFVRKPSPIQISWLGYPHSTGISAIDYRVVDTVTDPEGAEHFNSETLFRLPEGFLCYALPNIEPVLTPPFEKNGYITFGCFNNLSKINDAVIENWADILKATPTAKLMLKSNQFLFDQIRARFLGRFQEQGINSSRLILKQHTESTEEHLGLYEEVDIALDCFPYNGTTTSFEALSMGVPLVAVEGDTHASRVSASILRHSHLEKFLASSLKEYQKIAITLASAPHELRDLRHEVRAKIVNSTMTSRLSFATRFETMLYAIAEAKK